MPREATSPPAIAAVLLTGAWGPAERAWARAWAHLGIPVQRIVVDCSPRGLEIEGPLAPIHAPGAQGGAAANAALALVQAPWVLVMAHPVAPPRGLVGRLPDHPRVLLGSGEPPDGQAETALDTLLLHLLPPDAATRAPAVWPALPEGVFAVLPTAALRELGGFDPTEPHLVLATQMAALALSARDVPCGPLAGLRMGIPRRRYADLVGAIRDAAAARVLRLRRDPETPLESGWSLAGRVAVSNLLHRDTERPRRDRAMAAVADTDLQPLAASPDWAPVANDLLRRLMIDLRQQAQHWPLEGLLQGLDAAKASSVPGILSRHPLRLSRGDTVVVPVERHEPAALLRVLEAILHDPDTVGSTVAVVSGPSTGAALRASLARHWPSLRFLALLRGGDLILHPMPLSAARAVRLLSPATAWVPDRSLHSDAWGLHARVVGCPTVVARPMTPLSLPVDRAGRLLCLVPPLDHGPDWAAFVDGCLRPLAPVRELALVCIPPRDTPAAAVEARLAAAAPDMRMALHVLPQMVPSSQLSRLGAALHGVVGPATTGLVQSLGLPHHPLGASVVEAWTRAAGGLRRGP